MRRVILGIALSLVFSGCGGEGGSSGGLEPIFDDGASCASLYWPDAEVAFEAACGCELTEVTYPSATFETGCSALYVTESEGQVLLGLTRIDAGDDDPLAFWAGTDQLVAEPDIGDRSVLLHFDDPDTGASLQLYTRYGNALLTFTSPERTELGGFLVDETALLDAGAGWVEHLAGLD